MNLKREFFYGGRAALRDNWLCSCLVSRLRSHERIAPEALEALGRRYLYRSMKQAIKSLPYYSRYRMDFSEAEAPNALHSIFPIIDKAMLLDNAAELYPNEGVPSIWQSLGKTSGTTGSPLTVFRCPSSVLHENAFIQRHWRWFGFKNGLKRVTLRGDVAVPLSQSKPPFWFFNRFNNQLIVSSRHLKEEYVDSIVEKVDEFSPSVLQSYPSTAFALAQFLSHRNRYLKVPYVFTASEPLYAHQRQLIEERLLCQVKDMYGMAERVAFATECEHGNLHINPDYSYVEIVDDEGAPTNGYGTVVGTTFHNRAMPLIRYRLSDRTRWKPGVCGCGRSFPMIEPVTGKLEDSLYGSDGAFVSPSVLTFAFKGVENISKSQVAQTAPGRWEIRVVPGSNYSSGDQEQLVKNIHELVDRNISVEVILKNEIPNTSSGKFRWVINEMENT